MLSRIRVAGTIAALTVVVCAASGGWVVAADAATAGTASGYQQSASHDGNPSDTMRPPLTQRWHRDLGGTVSYPVIANGIAYVTVARINAYGTDLYALDVATGDTVWGPIDLGGTYSFSAVTYDAGRVFALNYNGLLRSFDATTGAALWTTQLPGQYSFTSAPTAFNGLVYTGGAGSGGTVYAVHENDGAVAWTASVANGDHSSPAVTPTGVYVSYACDQAYDFNPTTGALLWHHSGPCSGGGGKTVAVHNGRVYTRDYFGNLILDAATGATIGSYSATRIPAFDGSMGFFLDSNTLSAVDEGGTAHWTFTGDGSLTSAPIVDNGYVYVGASSGNLYALDEATGQVAWSTNVGSAIQAPDEQNATLLTGLAAAGGTLLVPAGSTLTAFDGGPSIVASASGTLGANGWYTSPVTVHFTCNAGRNSVTSCPSDVRLKRQGGSQEVTGTVTDSAGDTASTSITVSIDGSPPSIEVTSGSGTVNPSVQGVARDVVSGVSTVMVSFTSATGQVTEAATLSPCPNHTANCVAWSAEPPPGLLGTGSGPSMWTGLVTATATDIAGLTTKTQPAAQTLAH